MRNYESEVQIKTARSGGKGGQNVNKVETKVELIWHPESSNLLTDKEKQLLLERLAHKLDKEGKLHVTAQIKRTQLENKEIAFKKLHLLVEESLLPEAERKKTAMPLSVKLNIKREKSHQSVKKANRKSVRNFGDEE